MLVPFTPPALLFVRRRIEGGHPHHSWINPTTYRDAQDIPGTLRSTVRPGCTIPSTGVPGACSHRYMGRKPGRGYGRWKRDRSLLRRSGDDPVRQDRERLSEALIYPVAAGGGLDHPAGHGDRETDWTPMSASGPGSIRTSPRPRWFAPTSGPTTMLRTGDS
jgi:hypothetical protein